MGLKKRNGDKKKREMGEGRRETGKGKREKGEHDGRGGSMPILVGSTHVYKLCTYTRRTGKRLGPLNTTSFT